MSILFWLFIFYHLNKGPKKILYNYSVFQNSRKDPKKREEIHWAQENQYKIDIETFAGYENLASFFFGLVGNHN